MHILITQKVLEEQITHYERVLLYDDYLIVWWGQEKLGKIHWCPVCKLMNSTDVMWECCKHCPAAADGVPCHKQDWYELLKGVSYCSVRGAKGTRVKEMKDIIKKRLEYWVVKLEEFKKENHGKIN